MISFYTRAQWPWPSIVFNVRWSCAMGCFISFLLYYCFLHTAQGICCFCQLFPTFFFIFILLFFFQHLLLSTAYFSPFSFSIFIISYSCRMVFLLRCYCCIAKYLFYQSLSLLLTNFFFLSFEHFFLFYFFRFSHFHLLCFWLSELPSPHDCKAYFGKRSLATERLVLKIEEKRWQTNKTCLFAKKDKNTNEWEKRHWVAYKR